ncbi:MAG: RsmE family RNA methyltransferase [Bacteroidia bacterium]
MDLFFARAIDRNQLLLDEEELHHLRVLRKNVGEELLATDGLGNQYRAEIVSLKKNECILKVLSFTNVPAKTPGLHIAIAPTKNIDRIEWFTEKAVESGIQTISFLNCRHSERKEIRTDRIRKVAVSAMKQSGKYHLPVINEIISFSDFVNRNLEGKKLLATMTAPSDNHFKKMINHSEDAIVMIGPEGDFHPEEIEMAIAKGYQLVSLGPERLRTETAALASCMWFNFLNH